MPKKSSKARAGRVVRVINRDGKEVVYRYAAHDKKAAPRSSALPDTLGALIAAYENSPKFSTLAENSKQIKARAFGYLLGMSHVPVRDITRRVLMEQRDAVAKTRGHGAAANFAVNVTHLFHWAEKNEWVQHSVARGLLDDLTKGELKPWRESDYRRAITSNALPERIRRAIVLARWTAQRRGDLVKMRWSDMWTDSEGQEWIHVIQGKTGAEIDVPVFPELAPELRAWKAEANVVSLKSKANDGFMLLEISGEQWDETNLSVQVGRALANLPGFTTGLSLHGLRKFALADAGAKGATTQQLMAYGGHKTLAMVEHYTKSRDQIEAVSTMVKTVAGR